MKTRVIIYITITQLLLIGLLVNNIANKKKDVLGLASVNPIKKEDISLNPTENLKFFYEPVTSTNSAQFELGKYNARHTINSDTLNDRLNYSTQKPDGVFRIITLGDSFTYGLHVNTRENWTELLEDKLNTLSCKNTNKFEVINLGVGGYDNQYSLERYRKRGIKYSPDLIIWYQVDMMRDREKDTKILDENFKKAEKDQGEFHEEYAQGNFDPIFIKSQEELIYQVGEQNLLKFQVEKIKELKNLFNGPLLLPLNPPMNTVYKKYIYSALKNEANFHVFNLKSWDSIRSQILFQDRHPNEKGHKILADEIFEYIKNNNFVSCKN